MVIIAYGVARVYISRNICKPFIAVNGSILCGFCGNTHRLYLIENFNSTLVIICAFGIRNSYCFAAQNTLNIYINAYVCCLTRFSVMRQYGTERYNSAVVHPVVTVISVNQRLSVLNPLDVRICAFGDIIKLNFTY